MSRKLAHRLKSRKRTGTGRPPIIESVKRKRTSPSLVQRVRDWGDALSAWALFIGCLVGAVVAMTSFIGPQLAR